MTTTTSQYEKFFDELDADGSGSVNLDEMKKILSKKGHRDSEIVKFFKTGDTSADGKITRVEFLTAMGCATPEEIRSAAWRRAFNLFDTDGSGSINKTELEAVMEEAGKDFSAEEVATMMGMMDTSGDDAVNYEEFIEKFCKA